MSGDEFRVEALRYLRWIYVAALLWVWAIALAATAGTAFIVTEFISGIVDR